MPQGLVFSSYDGIFLLPTFIHPNLLFHPPPDLFFPVRMIIIPFILALFIIAFFPTFSTADRHSLYAENGEFLPHVRLSKDLVAKYDHRVRPVLRHSVPTRVNFTMSLYQILAINEKVQSVDLNLWVIQKWNDEFLGWDPHKYGGINATILPHHRIWLPDTYLYNSMVMNREESERYINVIVTTDYWKERRGAEVMFMFPALYRVSCRIHIQYFPYDQQNCTLVISSWTSDIKSIDYWPDSDTVNLFSFIPNEEWEVMSFEIRRVVEKFVCCPEPWVLLHASLVVRRKPLYYIVNLVLPTSVITLVAVTGFFTPASTSNERREKLSLGIDSLLAMSILMMMVSEQMPTTSEYVPLFGLFYLSIIVIIFSGTLITALVLNVHLQKTYNRPIPPLISYIFFHKIAPWLGLRPSTVLMELWQETGVCIRGLNDNYQRARSDSRKRVGRRATTAAAGASQRRKALLRQMASTEASGAPMMPETGAGGHGHRQQSPLDKFGARKHSGLLAKGSSNPLGNMLLPLRRISSGGGSGLRQRPAGVEEVLTPSMGGEEAQREWSVMEKSIAEEEEEEDADEEEEGPSANPHSGLSHARSVHARRNWRRIAQKASAQHRDALERGVVTPQPHPLSPQVGGGDVPLGIPEEDIPFADLSPGRVSLPPGTSAAFPRASPSALSPRFFPPPHAAGAPFKRPPPVPLAREHSFIAGPAPDKSPLASQLSPSLPPALQLLLLPPSGSGKKDAGANAAAALDLKLRRRFAYEWEFLATVLDRVLLIVFAGLVLFVTGAMMAIGELILRTYPGGGIETNTNNAEEENIVGFESDQNRTSSFIH